MSPAGTAPTPEGPTFRELIDRVRRGDGRAAEELVRRYEPAIRRTVRARLRGSALRRLLDSVDVCQSVLASFFVRAALGRYELGTPEQLLQLLTSMAHHKLTSHARRQGAQCRDLRRDEAGGPEGRGVADPRPGPGRQVAARELLEEVRRRLSDEERLLLDLRERGLGWDEVAAAVGSKPDAARKRLERALDRVAEGLDLGDGTLA
jgi:RNA polymerase sigma-70 factor (ECF subfamily)